MRRAAMPFFSKPFVGDFPIGNLFDHDKPLVFSDSNGYLRGHAYLSSQLPTLSASAD